MESEKKCQSYGHINYKTKLLGMVPLHWRFVLDSPWKTKHLKMCKKPSQYSEGQLFISDQATLVETGIVEKRFDLVSELDITKLSLQDQKNDHEDVVEGVSDLSCHSSSADTLNRTDDAITSADDNTNSNVASVQNVEVATETSIKKSQPEESSNDGKDVSEESSNEEESEKRDPPATTFVKQCFNYLKASTPDFLCERLALIYLGTEDISYVIKATKLRFTSEVDQEQNVLEAIELRFLDLRLIDEPLGSLFAKCATNDEDNTADGLNVGGTSNQKPEDKVENNNDDYSNLHKPYHHAFIEGELSKKGLMKDKKFTMLMAAQIGGVWNLEENPENYTCSHLAETKTANIRTIQSHEFYNRVRMQRNWFQAHLAGEKNYIVGINDNMSNTKFIKELRLYDVERIPDAVLHSAKEYNFEPWTPDTIHLRVFMSLEFIYDTMKDAKLDEKFIFIHYHNSNHFHYDEDESLLKQYIEEKCKLLIRNVPEGSPDITPRAHTIAQLKAIIKCVGYFAEAPMPAFARNRHEIELTFIEPSLADAFLSIVLSYWKRRINIPPGFERMEIKPKLIFEPQNFKGKYVRIACRSTESSSSNNGRRRHGSENESDFSRRNWRK